MAENKITKSRKRRNLRKQRPPETTVTLQIQNSKIAGPTMRPKEQ